MGTRQRPRRPAGIRNRGLVLVLTALALVMALVDGPGEQPGGRIAQAPAPLVAPVEPAGTDQPRPLRAPRGHPLRRHPRPAPR